MINSINRCIVHLGRMAAPFKWQFILISVFVVTTLTWYIHREWSMALMKKRGMEDDAMEIALSTVVKASV